MTQPARLSVAVVTASPVVDCTVTAPAEKTEVLETKATTSVLTPELKLEASQEAI